MDDPMILDRAITDYDYQKIIDLLSDNKLSQDDFDYGLVNSCRTGSIELVKLFIQCGADINAFNGNAIVWACKYSHRDIIPILLEMGINISNNGYECIEISIKNNLNDIVYMLYEYASHDIRQSDLTKFLELSMTFNNSMLKYWIDNGADTNKAFSNYIASNTSYARNNQTIKYFMEYGTNVMVHVTQILEQAIVSGDYELIKLMLDNGGSLQSINKNYYRWLMYNSKKNKNAITLLLENGYIFDDYNLITALIHQDNAEIILLLMKYGLDISRFNENEIYQCINVGAYNCLKLFLENNVLISELNKNNIRIIDEDEKNFPIFDLLRKYGHEIDINEHNRRSIEKLFLENNTLIPELDKNNLRIIEEKN